MLIKFKDRFSLSRHSNYMTVLEQYTWSLILELLTKFKYIKIKNKKSQAVTFRVGQINELKRKEAITNTPN